jgi:hypothetical protein
MSQEKICNTLPNFNFRIQIPVRNMDSPCESESSLDGANIMLPPSPVSREQLQKRIDSLTQQNKVLKVELDTYKIKVFSTK